MSGLYVVIIVFRYRIPEQRTDNAVRGQPEISPSRLDRRLRLRAKNAVRRNIRHALDAARENLEIFLKNSLCTARAAAEQIGAGLCNPRIVLIE